MEKCEPRARRRRTNLAWKTKGRRSVCAVPKFLLPARPRLRAGVPQAVSAEVGPRCRIVGAEALRAIGDVIAAGSRGNRPRAVVDIFLVIIGRTAVAIPVGILRS